MLTLKIRSFQDCTYKLHNFQKFLGEAHRAPPITLPHSFSGFALTSGSTLISRALNFAPSIRASPDSDPPTFDAWLRLCRGCSEGSVGLHRRFLILGGCPRAPFTLTTDQCYIIPGIFWGHSSESVNPPQKIKRSNNLIHHNKVNPAPQICGPPRAQSLELTLTTDHEWRNFLNTQGGATIVGLTPHQLDLDDIQSPKMRSLIIRRYYRSLDLRNMRDWKWKFSPEKEFIPEQFTVKAHPALFGGGESGEGRHYYSSLQLTYTFKTITKHKKTPKFRTECQGPSQKIKKYRKNTRHTI